MLKAGLTGGIGSGKSTVGKVFSALGIPIYQADVAAKRLYNTDSNLRNEMKALFGEYLYYTDGTIDRQKLAEIIFSDRKSLEQVNRLVHPAVQRDFLEYVASLPDDTPYVIHEAAILFEAGMKDMFDVVVNVCTPEEVRIKRILVREATTKKAIKQRIAAQWHDDVKVRLSDYNIMNDDKDLILPQILLIHEQLTQKAKQSK
jgi:dephospho-CoA kinase